MTIYKFRVMYEEDDSIFRDIEIKPSQSLIDFESVIVSSYNLPVSANGKFFKSNDNWQKLKQLNMAPVQAEEKKGKAKAKALSVPVLVAYLDDPHQKFIYEYHGSQEFVFLVELISLNGSEKATVIYPVCVRQQGPSPFKKEELVAHYTRGAEQEEEEEQAIDAEEDKLDAMNTEGVEEVEEVGEEEDTTEPESDTTPLDLEEATTDVDEPEEDYAGGEEEDEQLGEEEIGEDFGGDAGEDDDFR